MPMYARANGLWRGPDPPALANLTYAESKVINLAKLYVSVKRVFLNRGSYAATSKSEAPLYHQKNVVAYPQNPDAALRALGLSPGNLAKTLLVQFVGEDRERLRAQPELSVSVEKLRRAFLWLSVNSWPFMEQTKYHEQWQSGALAEPLEELLKSYAESVGSCTGGTPEELVLAASKIDEKKLPCIMRGLQIVWSQSLRIFRSPYPSIQTSLITIAARFWMEGRTI